MLSMPSLPANEGSVTLCSDVFRDCLVKSSSSGWFGWDRLVSEPGEMMHYSVARCFPKFLLVIYNCIFTSALIFWLSEAEKCNTICNDPISEVISSTPFCNLQAQMQTIQLKLENIRSIFETQQAGFRNLADKRGKPVPFVVPASDSLIRSRAPFFSSKQGKVSYSPPFDLFSSCHCLPCDFCCKYELVFQSETLTFYGRQESW